MRNFSLKRHDDFTCIGFFAAARIESSGHGKAEMKDVRVEEVEFLSQQHGQGLVAAVCFHLVSVQVQKYYPDS